MIYHLSCWVSFHISFLSQISFSIISFSYFIFHFISRNLVSGSHEGEFFLLLYLPGLEQDDPNHKLLHGEPIRDLTQAFVGKLTVILKWFLVLTPPSIPRSPPLSSFSAFSSDCFDCLLVLLLSHCDFSQGNQ